MHEIYLVKNIFDRIQEEFPEKYEDVSSVHLKVGLLSNVQPILIQNAYKAYVMECPEFYHTELVVDVLPVLIKCESRKYNRISLYVVIVGILQGT